jgi:hypothetical protein
VEETLEGLTRLVEEGKVRAVGVSNESAYQLVKALWASDKHGLVRHDTIQNNFSLLNRRFEDELAEVCRREQVSLLAYSPIAGGVLSGKYQGGAWPEGARFTRYRDWNPRTKVMTARFVNEQTLGDGGADREAGGPVPTCSSTRTTRSIGTPGGTRPLRVPGRRTSRSLLSIGYSACHWCHVMERESFERRADRGADERGCSST